MITEDADMEIEKLKVRKVELVNRMNLTTDFDDKEELQREIERLQKQIDILEKLKT